MTASPKPPVDPLRWQPPPVDPIAACSNRLPRASKIIRPLVRRICDLSKHDLQARPVYHDRHESIEAHLTIVFAALAVSHFIERQTGWSIKKFVRTARRYRTVQIKAGRHSTVKPPGSSAKIPTRQPSRLSGRGQR